MADKAEKKKQKKQGTISQIIQIFKYTQAEDKALPWLCGGVFVAPIVVFVVLGVIFKWHVFSWILFMILAVMLGVLFATMMLTKRADKVGYAKIEGRPGAAVSVLGNISKAGFNFPRNRCGLTRRPRTPSGAVPVTTASICWAKAITIASSEPWIVRSSASRA